ncbi:hypothetical protein LSAT2_012624 [Lamellibrachia satsuma]|nr:hypothetical protein LSAT2_012624 [Lamellibrachia satsuma]
MFKTQPRFKSEPRCFRGLLVPAASQEEAVLLDGRKQSQRQITSVVGGAYNEIQGAEKADATRDVISVCVRNTSVASLPDIHITLLALKQARRQERSHNQASSSSKVESMKEKYSRFISDVIAVSSLLWPAVVVALASRRRCSGQPSSPLRCLNISRFTSAVFVSVLVRLRSGLSNVGQEDVSTCRLHRCWQLGKIEMLVVLLAPYRDHLVSVVGCGALLSRVCGVVVDLSGGERISDNGGCTTRYTATCRSRSQYDDSLFWSTTRIRTYGAYRCRNNSSTADPTTAVT